MFVTQEIALQYNRARIAASKVARELGITLLLQSSPNTENDAVTAVYETPWMAQDLMSRVALVPDAAQDITELVMQRVVAEQDDTGAAKPAMPVKKEN